MYVQYTGVSSTPGDIHYTRDISLSTLGLLSKPEDTMSTLEEHHDYTGDIMSIYIYWGIP